MIKLVQVFDVIIYRICLHNMQMDDSLRKPIYPIYPAWMEFVIIAVSFFGLRFLQCREGITGESKIVLAPRQSLRHLFFDSSVNY